ncbi:MAG: hypothetical protein IPG99_07375 [Ignavibacteria bacterium]|nr:hypothetical protein [Ignavibacteria bacterium]
MYRFLKQVRIGGKEGIIHGLRGKSSNRGYAKELKQKVIEIYNSGYGDYGPTLYSEELLKVHSIGIDHETIRRWLRSSGIAVSIRKLRPHRKRRERRGSFGELLQFDGSPHDWFEERGPECCLFVCVDDATNYTYAKFARSENSADAMRTMSEYIEINGYPGACIQTGSGYIVESKSFRIFCKGNARTQYRDDLCQITTGKGPC